MERRDVEGDGGCRKKRNMKRTRGGKEKRMEGTRMYLEGHPSPLVGIYSSSRPSPSCSSSFCSAAQGCVSPV